MVMSFALFLSLLPPPAPLTALSSEGRAGLSAISTPSDETRNPFALIRDEIVGQENEDEEFDDHELAGCRSTAGLDPRWIVPLCGLNDSSHLPIAWYRDRLPRSPPGFCPLRNHQALHVQPSMN